MTNKGLSKLGLRLLDFTTDRFHSFGPKVFQSAFVGFFGSRIISESFLRKYRQETNEAFTSFLASASTGRIPKKILVMADVCIGDTVLISEVLPILREGFPDIEIHFLCNRTGGELIKGMPGIRVHALIQGKRGFPTPEDIEAVRGLIKREGFPLVLNFGPFFSKRSLGRATRVLPLYVPMSAYILAAWKKKGVRHISALCRSFLREFLFGPQGMGPLESNSIYLSERSLREADAFLERKNISNTNGILFWNPDATSQFGQIPFDVQVNIVGALSKHRHIGAILVGRAYSNSSIEESLLASVPERFRRKIHIVPHMPLETYTALIDRSEMYVSGDTGPLHIAACRKFSKDGRPLRNRTAVTAIYGATDSRMYGYDSEQAFHAPANQDAPSRSFSAPAPCRNISCINKFGKTCGTVRCFDGLPVTDIVSYISNYFTNLTRGLMEWNGNDREQLQEPISISLTPEREYAL